MQYTYKYYRNRERADKFVEVLKVVGVMTLLTLATIVW